MQKIAQLWNAGCLGKLAIGLIALIILSCIGGVFGNRRSPQQTIAPSPVLATSAPIPTKTLQPTETPTPITEPQPTKVPEPTAAPQSIAVPTSMPELTAEPPRTTNPVGVSPIDKNNCPPDAPIKGNIVDRGPRKGEKIYHTPGSSSYTLTNPERCFATAADAEAAGFRPPK